MLARAEDNPSPIAKVNIFFKPLVAIAERVTHAIVHCENGELNKVLLLRMLEEYIFV
jgi:hypothetical protein